MNEETSTEKTPAVIDLTFRPFPKMPRLSRDIVITEKLDGTNAQILIVPSAQLCATEYEENYASVLGDHSDPKAVTIWAGSRNRWIQPGNDNYGFAAWVNRNAEELAKLGPGRHFGEWWGQGIQRNYQMKEKRFSLFNVNRWGALPCQNRIYNLETGEIIDGVTTVPTLYTGEMDTKIIERVLCNLATYGSSAAPGFMDPEGIIIFHTAAQHGFKKTIKHDESPKSLPDLTNPKVLAAGVEAAQHVFQSKIKS